MILKVMWEENKNKKGFNFKSIVNKFLNKMELEPHHDTADVDNKSSINSSNWAWNSATWNTNNDKHNEDHDHVSLKDEVKWLIKHFKKGKSNDSKNESNFEKQVEWMLDTPELPQWEKVELLEEHYDNSNTTEPVSTQEDSKSSTQISNSQTNNLETNNSNSKTDVKSETNNNDSNAVVDQIKSFFEPTKEELEESKLNAESQIKDAEDKPCPIIQTPEQVKWENQTMQTWNTQINTTNIENKTIEDNKATLNIKTPEQQPWENKDKEKMVIWATENANPVEINNSSTVNPDEKKEDDGEKAILDLQKAIKSFKSWSDEDKATTTDKEQDKAGTMEIKSETKISWATTPWKVEIKPITQAQAPKTENDIKTPTIQNIADTPKWENTNNTQVSDSNTSKAKEIPASNTTDAKSIETPISNATITKKKAVPVVKTETPWTWTPKTWGDIFSWIIGKKDNELKWKKIEIWENKKTQVQINEKIKPLNLLLFSFVNTVLPIALIACINISIWMFVFFEINLDTENKYLSKIDSQNLDIIIDNAKNKLKKKKDNVNTLKLSIERELVNIPDRIYYKNVDYKLLSEDIKKELLKYYHKDTWMLIVWRKPKELKSLKNLFINNKQLAGLKIYFEKEHVLNSIIEDKIYWKEVYKDLQEATNNTFRYNDILDYITYNNFSVDSKWKISVSWMVTDPSWKVFNQLISLVNTINDNDNFHWANIATFSKTLNPNKSIWWMVSPLNLSFFYKNTN